MTVCIAFKDMMNNGFLVADSSRSLDEILIDSGHKKIKELSLRRKRSLCNMLESKHRRIGLAFAGDSEIIDTIISEFNKPFFVKRFHMRECFINLTKYLHKKLHSRFGLVSKDLQILFIGYCDQTNKIAIYEGKMNFSKQFNKSWTPDEYCTPGKGPGQIGFGLPDACLDNKTLESICKCFIERKKSQPTVSLPLTHGKLPNTGKDFEYLGEYTCE